MMMEHTRPSRETREEEAREALKAHDSGAEPSAGEETAADENPVDPAAREHYQEMVERGARQEGEGKPGV
jgi:hypothetical protein